METKYSKYDVLQTKTLIKYIQDEAKKLKDPKHKKKSRSTKSMIRKMNEIGEMQYVLSVRLKNMNRLDPLFFPVGCDVEFNKPDHLKAIHEEGVVMGHEEGCVLVLMNNSKDPACIIRPVKVEPRYLKLLYLRQRL